MQVSRTSLLGFACLALLAGTSGAVGAQVSESQPTTFPTGEFVSLENGYVMLDLHEDGTGVAHNSIRQSAYEFTYAVDGDVYHWLTSEYAGAASHNQPSYTWQHDGEHLTFELLGEDTFDYRRWVYADNTYRFVEDPVVALVATDDIAPGDSVFGLAAPWFVPAADLAPGAFSGADGANVYAVVGQVAAAPIPKGQPITPDLLQPAE